VPFGIKLARNGMKRPTQPLIKGEMYPGCVFAHSPRNVYWEMTVACDLTCKHCRADANPHRHPDELSTAEGRQLIGEVAEMGSMLVLTGGDPMKRADLFELMAYARDLSVPLAITPAVTPLLTKKVLEKFRELGVSALGLSLEGASAELHDGFRGVAGTFDRSREALEWAREFGLAVQVNTTLTRETIPHLDALYRFLSEQFSPPIRRWSLFLLVPVGRGAELAAPSAGEVERVFAWVYQKSADAPFHIATVEAPHYRRFWIVQKLSQGISRDELNRKAPSMGFGIRDGNGIVFVSHLGQVFPAGFLPFPELGNVKRDRLGEIYRQSQFLKELRDADLLKGKCGRCEFRWACGGSRARAYQMLGDPFESEPLCAYSPVDGNAG
jgi:AdoMet-dependent heme synthase